MADEQNKKDETIFDRWEYSHYTYVGNVFDAPEHQEALSKMTNIDDRIAYKRKVLQQQRKEYLGHD